MFVVNLMEIDGVVFPPALHTVDINASRQLLVKPLFWAQHISTKISTSMLFTINILSLHYSTVKRSNQTVNWKPHPTLGILGEYFKSWFPWNFMPYV